MAGYTTRFWDCCKPSCSWPGNVSGGNPAVSCNQQNQTTSSSTQSACSNGSAYACYSFAPWAVSSTAPRVRVPVSRSTRSASTAAAMPPFMSAEPLPVMRPSATAGGT